MMAMDALMKSEVQSDGGEDCDRCNEVKNWRIVIK